MHFAVRTRDLSVGRDQDGAVVQNGLNVFLDRHPDQDIHAEIGGMLAQNVRNGSRDLLRHLRKPRATS